jgi:hypothetical protein
MAKLLDFSLLFACSSGFNDFSDNDFACAIHRNLRAACRDFG